MGRVDGVDFVYKDDGGSVFMGYDEKFLDYV